LRQHLLVMHPPPHTHTNTQTHSITCHPQSPFAHLLLSLRHSRWPICHNFTCPHPPASLQPNGSSCRSSTRPQQHLTGGNHVGSCQQQPQHSSRNGSTAHCSLAGHISGLKIEAQDQ